MDTNSSDVAAKVADFFSKYLTKQYKKGEILIFAGRAPEGVFLLKEGTVSQYDINSKGDKVVVNVFKPGAFLPMAWAYSKNENNFFYEADTAVVVVLAPAGEVVKFVDDNPTVLRDLLSRVYRGMDGLLKRQVELMGGSANSRLALELVISARRFGQIQADGSYLLDITERDLADRTGLSRETVNREISKFKTNGYMSVENGSISIKSLEQLEDITRS